MQIIRIRTPHTAHTQTHTQSHTRPSQPARNDACENFPVQTFQINCDGSGCCCCPGAIFGSHYISQCMRGGRVCYFSSTHNLLIRGIHMYPTTNVVRAVGKSYFSHFAGGKNITHELRHRDSKRKWTHCTCNSFDAHKLAPKWDKTPRQMNRKTMFDSNMENGNEK